MFCKGHGESGDDPEASSDEGEGAGKQFIPGKVIRTLGTLSLERGRLKADVIAAFKYLNGRCKEDRQTLFSLFTDGRARGNGFKLQQHKLQLNLRKKKLSNFRNMRPTKQAA